MSNWSAFTILPGNGSRLVKTARNHPLLQPA